MQMNVTPTERAERFDVYPQQTPPLEEEAFPLEQNSTGKSYLLIPVIK
jgi:hypothetical protein